MTDSETVIKKGEVKVLDHPSGVYTIRATDGPVTVTLPQAKPEWISVEDRLPQVRVPVLTVKKDGKIIVDWIQSMLPRPYFWKTFPKNPTTHWMPLPEPPNDKRR